MRGEEGEGLHRERQPDLERAWHAAVYRRPSGALW
jgi:hypothetical protein